MKKIRIFFGLFMAVMSLQLHAQQNVSISDVNGATPNASSVLDISSSSKGLLIPRVALTITTSQSPIVATPQTSLLVYNTVTSNDVSPGYYHWDGSKWVRFDTGNNIGDWKLLGNTGTNAGTNFLGTTDNVDLVFRTNSIEKMRVMSSGNVGIGESNPQRILHLKGSTSNVALRLENTSAKIYDIQSTSGGHLHLINQSSSPTFVAMQVNGTTNNIGFFNGTPDVSASLDITALDPISSLNTRGLLIPRLSLTATNAASPVTSPATSLLVYNSATAGTSPNNVSPGYYYNAGNTTTPNWKRFATGNGDAWITVGNTSLSSPATPTTYGTSTIGTSENWIGTTDAVDFVVGTNTIERLRVKQSSGKVGIGTAAPAMRLDVTDASITTSDATIRGAATGNAATYGVLGTSSSATGQGVFGFNSNTAGTGVIGAGNNLTAQYLTNGSGGAFSSSNVGVFGYGNNTASSYGVYGQSINATGVGVFGQATSTTGVNFGMYALTSSPAGDGINAINNVAAGTGDGNGVYATTAQTTGYGVWGTNSNSIGTGVVGSGNGVTSSYLTSGSGGAFTGSTIGAYCFGSSTLSTGVLGVGNNLSGSTLTSGSGVAGAGTRVGVYGRASDETTTGSSYTSINTSYNGVLGYSTGNVTVNTDLFHFGVHGRYGDIGSAFGRRSGGVLGSNNYNLGATLCWASLGYLASSNTPYAMYYTTIGTLSGAGF